MTMNVFPRGRVLGGIDAHEEKIFYSVEAKYEMLGTVIDALHELMTKLELDDLPGEVKTIQLSQFAPGRWDIEIGWHLDAGAADPDLLLKLRSSMP
jgi:hypothetical protein